MICGVLKELVELLSSLANHVPVLFNLSYAISLHHLSIFIPPLVILIFISCSSKQREREY